MSLKLSFNDRKSLIAWNQVTTQPSVINLKLPYLVLYWRVICLQQVSESYPLLYYPTVIFNSVRELQFTLNLFPLNQVKIWKLLNQRFISSHFYNQFCSELFLHSKCNNTICWELNLISRFFAFLWLIVWADGINKCDWCLAGGRRCSLKGLHQIPSVS